MITKKIESQISVALQAPTCVGLGVGSIGFCPLFARGLYSGVSLGFMQAALQCEVEKI